MPFIVLCSKGAKAVEWEGHIEKMGPYFFTKSRVYSWWQKGILMNLLKRIYLLWVLLEMNIPVLIQSELNKNLVKSARPVEK